jgi:hypothetical protein
MTESVDAARARAYLLGALDDRERDRVEESYIAGAGSLEAIETIEAAEESLIDDYLSDALSGDERDRFERHYLAVPRHQTRVETVRRLAGAAARPARQRPQLQLQLQLRWLALAAGLVLAAGATFWITEHTRETSHTGAPAIAPSGGASTAAVVMAPAFALAPVTVRGGTATETPALVVPPGANVVNLQLQGDGSEPPVAKGRAVIRTVAGDDVWQGPIEASAVRPAGTIAVVYVEAARLRPDDYTVALFEIRASGVESERARYFLRVRAR